MTRANRLAHVAGATGASPEPKPEPMSQAKRLEKLSAKSRGLVFTHDWHLESHWSGPEERSRLVLGFRRSSRDGLRSG